MSKSLFATLKEAYKKWREESRPEGATDLRFSCSLGGSYTSQPIELARENRPEWFKNQAKTMGQVKFTGCPGMFDTMRQGYLICAHTDIHIRATPFATHVKLPLVDNEPRSAATRMDQDVVRGIAPFEGVQEETWKIPLPWGLHFPEGYTAHILPAYMHSPHLFKNIFIYPGDVDYDGFHTINVIIGVVRECEMVIPAGTPLLHILPYKRENFHAISGPATQIEKDRHLHGYLTRVKGAYHRKLLKPKKYTIEVIK